MIKRFHSRCWQAALIFSVAATCVATPALAGDPFKDAKKEHWGVIARNTIGSGVAQLRYGPYVPGSEPPFGKGSLGLQVSNNALSGSTPQEKVDFGNEVDFAGVPVAALQAVGFFVFQTGENADISARNMPNIRMEIDPDVGGKHYTSMVWVPDAAPVVNQWSDYIDATTTGNWYFTNGTVAAATGCGSGCNFADAMSALAAQTASTPIIMSVAVGKGRDNAWVGAVDGLRLNNTIYDFEPDGVKHKGVKD